MNTGIIGKSVLLKNDLKALILDKIIVKEEFRGTTGPYYSSKEYVNGIGVTNYLVKLYKKVPRIVKDENGVYRESDYLVEIVPEITTISPGDIKKVLDDVQN